MKLEHENRTAAAGDIEIDLEKYGNSITGGTNLGDVNPSGALQGRAPLVNLCGSSEQPGAEITIRVR